MPSVELEEELFLPKQFSYEDLDVPRPRVPGVSVNETTMFSFALFMLVNVSPNIVYRCTASLVTYRWVLTAAHCFTLSNATAKDIIFIGGIIDVFTYLLLRRRHPFHIDVGAEINVQERRLALHWVHPHFDVGGAPFDIALVKLKKKFDNLKPIQWHLGKVRQVLTKCTMVGWGDDTLTYFDGRLRFATDLYASTPELGCRDKKKGPYLCLNNQIKNLCIGDAGSPLICNNKIYGIASHYGRLKGIDMFSPRCHPSARYYCNSLYFSHTWLHAITRSDGSILLIRWRVILAWVLLSVHINY